MFYVIISSKERIYRNNFRNIFTDLFTITTGCEKIDAVLGGGLRRSSGVYELSGESGCGKTQLCLQLTLTAQNPLSLGGIDKCMIFP